MIFKGLAKTLKGMAHAGLDFVLPPRCLGCHGRVQNTHSLCGECWGQITFINDPRCAHCGYPFSFEQAGQDNVCGACLRTPPPFERGYSLVTYNAGSKPLLLKFKHGDRTELTPLFTQWLLQARNQFFEDIDLLIPVPLHARRLLSRQYNQAALLTKELSKKTNIPWSPDFLIRTKATVSQGHLSPKARHQNVKNAFSCPSQFHENLRDKRCLLIDDVWTSGATLKACSKTLLESGARTVFVLTVARVV